MPKISARHQGYAAELLVCFEFVIRGYDATVTTFPGSPYDVLVELGKGSPLRIQVKSTLKQQPTRYRKEGKIRSSKYQFTMRNNTFQNHNNYEGIDLFAFVVLNEWLILYVPTESLKSVSRSKDFGVKSFHENAPGSLDRFLFNKFLE